MAWSLENLAKLVVMVILIILLVYFLYVFLSPESSAAGAVDTLWGGIIPSS